LKGSQRLGYSSSSSFIRLFCKRTGETPDEYQRARLAEQFSARFT
jgi:AraC-like DNA-binding protein